MTDAIIATFTDPAAYAVAVRERHVPEEPDMGYCAAWISPSGEIFAVTRHSAFLAEMGFEGIYTNAFEAGYVRLVIKWRGGIGVEGYEPTMKQVNAITSLFSELYSKSAYVDVLYGSKYVEDAVSLFSVLNAPIGED